MIPVTAANTRYSPSSRYKQRSQPASDMCCKARPAILLSWLGQLDDEAKNEE